MWDNYHVFLIAVLVFTRLLLDEIYHLIELLFDWLTDDAMFVCLLDTLILGLCYSDMTWETGGFELTLTINFILPPIFNYWFTFYSDSRNYEICSSSKGLLKVKTVNAKKYGREAMTNNAISSWNITQKIISSHVLRDLSYFKLKSLIVKHFLKSYSNNA